MKKNPDLELWVNYSKRHKDIIFHYPRRCDGSLLHYYLSCKRMIYDSQEKHNYSFEKSLIEELEERGYDISTLKFSIKLKKSKDE